MPGPPLCVACMKTCEGLFCNRTKSVLGLLSEDVSYDKASMDVSKWERARCRVPHDTHGAQQAVEETCREVSAAAAECAGSLRRSSELRDRTGADLNGGRRPMSAVRAEKLERARRACMQPRCRHQMHACMQRSGYSWA